MFFFIGAAGVGKSSLMYKFSTMFTENYIYYYSLKELILNSEKKVHFFEMLNKALHLNSQSMNLILFLDGFDEIANLLDEDEFIYDLTKYHDNNISIIFTTRPGYIFESLYGENIYPFIKFGYIEPFQLKQVNNWLIKYKRNNESVNDRTISSITAITEKEKIFEIISIPIILYIITNQNIILSEITSVGQLYEKVFFNLTRDKSLYVKNKYINIHYNIAKEVAFIMYRHDWMSISEIDIVKNLSVIFDHTFYSSVYMNKIIEGTHMSEFVHKSIQDFFAAKWIWEQLYDKLNTDEFIYELLSVKKISSDMLDYILFFSSKYNPNDIKSRIVIIVNNFIMHNSFFNMSSSLDEYIKTTYEFLENLFTIYYKIFNKTFDIRLLTTKKEMIKLLKLVSVNSNEFIAKIKITNEDLFINNNVDEYNLSENILYGCTFKKIFVNTLRFNNSILLECKWGKSNINNLLFENSDIQCMDLSNLSANYIEIKNSNALNIYIMGEMNKLHIINSKNIREISITCKYLCDSKIERSTLFQCKIYLKNGMFMKDSIISNTTFIHTSFNNVNFYQCKLTNIIFDSCDFKNVFFINSSMNKIEFHNCIGLTKKVFNDLLTEDEVKFYDCLFL